jgi:hypothetical protein
MGRRVWRLVRTAANSGVSSQLSSWQGTQEVVGGRPAMAARSAPAWQ